MIRRHLSYANVASTLALVFAMSGGALAAKHYLISSTRQISPKVLRSLHGARGPAGAPGASGAQGPAGAKGETGPGGGQGPQGSPGESVKITAAGAECAEGGMKFSDASGSGAACNGKEGKAGSPWTAGGVLPQGATETGTWTTQESAAEVSLERVSISFPVQLSKPLAARHSVFVTIGEQEAGSGASYEHCEGSAEAPRAKEGYLCVYQGHEANPKKGSFELGLEQSPGDESSSAGVAGIILNFVYEGEASPGEEHGMFGSWAVTGE